ncbi:similar to Saccharomyces cerevisiae YML052W SUR7 Plasma membrane protein that localizes to furrow-like invaginations (MCC patches) [Maudiozyma barnettii]|uniref:Similar to Saccharomyces cerevisiae YML052W SUR7 Plasma membrane protein that localizes to furrow-like invaginations (MCC patches) n=1 Tax=Maudiozyma barnettii TaxID=61262 RepID=A0A8H2VFN8_9SACH|nr:Sur7p [Kazachstania barnettii]CAB4254726.1 similar to Saccharomyces cerevisiae YML052W SUR7 Plasma membrane protein that localizes to furrow-like invaginations (MCC patches) [Kazachstania barnettii]CAD1782768.1 similar to Saccharomyces cerevisiae YML052W SUR7 Plasma membrane protein that localizes to furrow-like invaginations (MCC patches) [Kazachstania barnettii]
MKFSAKLIWKLVTLLFFAGNVLLLILIIISGTTQHYPVNRFYWVEADTTGIPNASTLTRWTFWGACDRVNDKTVCSQNLSPAYPISPVDNFNTHENVPHRFISERDAYYYLSRFAFCFFWIALAFVGISFILFILTWVSGTLLQVVFILMGFGCVFNVCAVVLQTAVTVMTKSAFHGDDRHSKIGASLMGIAWASVFVSIWEFVSVAFWYTSRKLREYYEGSSLTEKHHNNFFHRDNEPLNVPEPLMSPDAYSPVPNINMSNDNNGPMINPSGVTNNETLGSPNLPIVQEPITTPLPAVVPAEESRHKGINFFTIRRSHKPNPDDVSV